MAIVTGISFAVFSSKLPKTFDKILCSNIELHLEHREENPRKENIKPLVGFLRLFTQTLGKSLQELAKVLEVTIYFLPWSS